MRIDILTIFPEIFEAPLKAGLLGKAIEAGTLEVVVRTFAISRAILTGASTMRLSAAVRAW